MNPPVTYAEWCKVLDIAKNKTDDAGVLLAIANGKIEWQAGVAERFTRKLSEVIYSRLDEAHKRFQRAISHAYGSEIELNSAIITLRKEYQFLLKLVQIDAIPEKYTSEYKKIIIAEADKTQKSLLESAKADKTGKLAYILRSTRVNSL